MKKSNKKLKCLFFLTKVILTYLSKEPKLTNWANKKINQLNLAMWKKNNIKIIKKKHLFILF
jgi:hypothetical protein